jgi:excisionase family DNA binding protein
MLRLRPGSRWLPGVPALPGAGLQGELIMARVRRVEVDGLEYITISELAARLRLHVRRVQEMIDTGQLPAGRAAPGGRLVAVYWPSMALAAWLDANLRPAEAALVRGDGGPGEWTAEAVADLQAGAWPGSPADLAARLAKGQAQ